jgi:hypothetical protein
VITNYAMLWADFQMRDISNSLSSNTQITWVIDSCFIGNLIDGLPYQFCGSKLDLDECETNLKKKNSNNENTVLLSSCLETELSAFYNNAIGSCFTFAWLEVLRKANGSVHHDILVYNINKILMEIPRKAHNSSFKGYKHYCRIDISHQSKLTFHIGSQSM